MEMQFQLTKIESFDVALWLHTAGIFGVAFKTRLITNSLANPVKRLGANLGTCLLAWPWRRRA